MLKIEAEHEKVMGEVSHFLGLLSPLLTDYNHLIETVHHEMAEKERAHESEVRELQSHQRYTDEKIETCSQ